MIVTNFYADGPPEIDVRDLIHLGSEMVLVTVNDGGSGTLQIHFDGQDALEQYQAFIDNLQDHLNLTRQVRAEANRTGALLGAIEHERELRPDDEPF